MEISGWQLAIDSFFLILCLIVIYIAISRGTLSEVFKITGLFVGSFFAFQYYSFLGDSIKNNASLINKDYLYLFSFLLILLGIGAVFSLIRLIVTFLFKREKISFRERWISFFAGALRAGFLVSIVIFILSLAPFEFQHLHNTLSYRIFRKVAPKAYLLSFKIYNQFDSGSTINEKVRNYYNPEE